jgi:hypothetical protein
MIEVAGAVADEANRKKVVDGILDFVQALDAINREKGPFTRLSFLNPSIFRWHGMNQPFKGNLKIEYGANINLESGLEYHKQVIAGRVSTRSRHWNACLLIVRDHIEETATRSDWRSCMVFSNSALSDIRDKRIHDSLIIVDGDLDVTGKLAISRSLVFVNGRIKTFNAFGISESYLAANGKITIQQVDATESTLFSRNTIRVPDDQRFRQVPRSEPFGLQFFQLSDVGVATNIHIGGAEITALSPFSPLRLFGLRVGDVITKVDDRAVDSTDALRRGLRTAYVREAGVFYLLRNGQAIDRIVLFGDYQLPK